jgi:hypothetical protein
MKNLFSIIVFSVCFISVQAQEINKKQWTLFSKTTADWCSLCGGWGWELHKQLIQNLDTKNTIIWALHTSSSGLTNKASREIITNLGSSGQPLFYESQTNMNASSSNIATKVNEAVSIVDLNQILDPIAGIGLLATIDDQKNIQVNADVQFFTAVEVGNYFLGLYLVEDKLVHSQANQGPNAVHRYVLRESLFSNTFGENLATGAIQKDKKFNVQANLSNAPGNRDNLKIAAIIWNRGNDGKYKFFNANMVDVAKVSSEKTPHFTYDVKAVFQQDQLAVTFQHTNVVPKVSLSLADVTGKIVFSTDISGESAWEKTFQLPLPSGAYFLQVDAGLSGISTKKLIKQ